MSPKIDLGLVDASTVTVRYIVCDVDEAIAFYRDQLGFVLIMHPAPPFAILGLGPLRLLLSQPGAGGGGHALPDGSLPQPGGWNRISLAVRDLSALTAALKARQLRIRGALVQGPGGMQILLEDPSGNAIELFQRSG